MNQAALVRHSQAQHIFAAWREQGARTWLFAGPNGVGRLATARYVAQWLNCNNPGTEPCGTCSSCALFLSGTHPDFFVVEPVRARAGARIGIEQLVPREGSEVQPLSDWLERPPFAQWRVGVIAHAHTMTPAAANAFLKRLEEPPARSVIILLAPDQQQLLPTVASRVVPYRFTAVRVEHSPVPGHPAEHLGQPGLIAELVGDDELAAAKRVAEAVQVLLNDIHADLHTVFQYATELQEAHEAAEQLGIVGVFPFLLEHTRTLPAAQFQAAQDAVLEAETKLAQHANMALTFMALALRLRTIL